MVTVATIDSADAYGVWRITAKETPTKASAFTLRGCGPVLFEFGNHRNVYTPRNTVNTTNYTFDNVHDSQSS